VVLIILCPFLLQWTGSANINWQRLRFSTKNITGVPFVFVNKHQRASESPRCAASDEINLSSGCETAPLPQGWPPPDSQRPDSQSSAPLENNQNDFYEEFDLRMTPVACSILTALDESTFLVARGALAG